MSDSCKYTFEKVDKTITINRNPKQNFDHIMHEEIVGGIDSIELVTDYGGKFISDNQVFLGGFQKSRTELMLIDDLMISAIGSSKIAAEYGAYIMRELRVFDTI